MQTKQLIKSQYHAALEMLRQAILSCPDDLWESSAYQNRTWHIAYHALFYTHFYLSPSENRYKPWEKHKDEYTSLGDSHNHEQTAYAKDELLAYLAFCREQVDAQVDAMDLEAESGFYWLPFNKLELQIYNIRHIQHHTGELSERLGAKGDIEVDWVGMKPD